MRKALFIYPIIESISSEKKGWRLVFAQKQEMSLGGSKTGSNFNRWKKSMFYPQHSGKGVRAKGEGQEKGRNHFLSSI